MDFIEILRSRRSTRKFTEERISKEELSEILLAANAAPIGSNLYENIHLTVVQSRDVLDKLGQAGSKIWADKARLNKLLGSYKPEADKPDVPHDPFHGARTVIVVSHRKQDVQPGIEYCNVACVVYSMHLATVNLGLGSVFMWFPFESMRVMPELDHTDLLSLPDDFEPLLGLAVGHLSGALPVRNLSTDKISRNTIG
jgi:nitroreductase